MQWAGIDLSQPIIMGILNMTPDSFSDGGDYVELHQAVARAESMCAAGAKIIDIGGESTRPGADDVDTHDEINRVLPAIQMVRKITDAYGAKISIDTRRAAVMPSAADFARKVTCPLWPAVAAIAFSIKFRSTVSTAIGSA